eukprot:gene683-12899_t
MGSEAWPTSSCGLLRPITAEEVAGGLRDAAEPLLQIVRRVAPAAGPQPADIDLDAVLRSATDAMPDLWHADKIISASRRVAERKLELVPREVEQRNLTLAELWAVAAYTYDLSLDVEGWDKANGWHNFYSRFNVICQERDEPL